jgi:hypothetical protein
MKPIRFCLAFLALFPLLAQGETETPEGWSFAPHGRPFGILPSDPRDLHLGLRKNNKSELEADVGGYRSLAGWRRGDTLFHAGIEGGAFFQLRQEGSRFPLASSDGLLGVYGEAARGDDAYQLRYSHISAHVADGLFGARSPFIYTREFLVLRYARRIAWFRPYVGYQLLTHTVPAVSRHAFQLGGYAIPPMHWGAMHPYFGADLRVRGAEEGTTFQLAGGAAFVPANGGAPIRVTAAYLKGHDLRGQFFREKTEKWTFGLDLDL